MDPRASASLHLLLDDWGLGFTSCSSVADFHRCDESIYKTHESCVVAAGVLCDFVFAKRIGSRSFCHPGLVFGVLLTGKEESAVRDMIDFTTEIVNSNHGDRSSRRRAVICHRYCYLPAVALFFATAAPISTTVAWLAPRKPFHGPPGNYHRRNRDQDVNALWNHTTGIEDDEDSGSLRDKDVVAETTWPLAVDSVQRGETIYQSHENMNEEVSDAYGDQTEEEGVEDEKRSSCRNLQQERNEGSYPRNKDYEVKGIVLIE